MVAPQVSVVIPTYNSSKYLSQAIDSVLAQTFSDLEVLVIDDGSTDDTEQLVGRYSSPIKYIRQPNSGVSIARHRGIAESVGRYVAFLDADDIWLPHKLERQLGELKNNPGFRACYSTFRVVDANLRPLEINRVERQGSTLEDLLTAGNVVGTPSTVLCERALLLSIAGFDPDLSYGADWDLWIRLAVLTEFLWIDEPLINYRQHGNNMSRNVPLIEKDSLLLLEKGFAMSELPEALRSKRRSAIGRNYMVLAGCYYHAHRYRDCVRCATRSITMDFYQIRYLTSFPLRIAARLKTRNLSEAA